MVPRRGKASGEPAGPQRRDAGPRPYNEVMRWLAILLLLLPWSAVPQTKTRKKAPAKPKPAATAPAKFPIETLAVEGNRNYSREQILAVAELRTGQPASKELFESARERLMATGAFESVGYGYQPSKSGKGYSATLQVAEVAQVYPFRFERLHAPADQLIACLKSSDPLFAEKLPGTQPVLDRYARAIEACPAAKDVGDKVAGKLMADDAGQMFISFRPATPPPSVAEVHFTGNQVIEATVLQNAIASVAIGAVFTEQRFRQLLDMGVRPLYEARGRVRVAFPKITAEPSAQVKGVVVKVEVDEGQVYQLGDVRFSGAGLPVDGLRKAGDFKTGDIANFTEIGAGMERMKQALRRNGHMKPEIRLDRSIRDTGKIVDITLQVEPGPRYVLGKLVIQGLDMHGEAAIRKLWTVKPGAPFDAGYPDYFLQQIKEDGVFDNLKGTKSKIDVDEKNLVVNVTLIFK